MVFSSSLFLFLFLPVVLLIYYLTGPSKRNIVALLASIIFYAWGGPWFIFLVLASITLDFYIVRWMSGCTGGARRWALGLSILLNVGLLLYFKYANFFVENLNAFLLQMGVGEVGWTQVALPIGISFFTFQKMSYSIDVYRRRHGPLSRIWDYALYILLFPQLIAGPIVRYHEIADQLIDRSREDTIDNRLLGMFRFILGLAKKVLIANVLGAQVDFIFSQDVQYLTTYTAWLGVIAYSFQIYYDFSGYSDMAIGIGKMLGFRFPENFNNPYISSNISEFWRRWHMTLGRWMKDYLYIPLGGSRVVTRRRLYLNLWIVFLISGLWHGAAWNFMVWGAFHGLFLVLDRIFLIRFTDWIGKIPSVIITYLITLIGWVLFRADTLSEAWAYLRRMFSWHGGIPEMNLDTHFWVIMAVGTFFAFYAIVSGVENWQDRQLHVIQTQRRAILYFTCCLFLLIYCMASITSSGFNPFIYFRF